MLKLFLTCATLIAFGGGSASAQQHEAMLQKVEVPGAVFDIVLAMPKTPGAVIDLGSSPDALVIHLIGGKLALAFESGEQMLKTFDSLQNPIGSFSAPGTGSNSALPVAVYIVPKVNTLASVEK